MSLISSIANQFRQRSTTEQLFFHAYRQILSGEEFKNGWKMMNAVPDLKKSTA
jgi:hypothetical protein